MPENWLFLQKLIFGQRTRLTFFTKVAVFDKAWFWAKSKAIGLPFSRELAVFDKAYFSPKDKVVGLPFFRKWPVFERDYF